MKSDQPKTIRRWMLVDDDENILAFMREIISRFGGIETECYDSPYKALAAFAASPKDYELVITDLEMPGMDGIELCHRLIELSPDAKVLLSTGGETVSKESATREGFIGLLHKPFPFQEVQKIMDDMGLAKISHPQ
ncbi:MAG TPA: response regulator [Verrucomicrobiae bacterium]|jgi:DNA-binding NtrC family response regulator